MDDKKESVAICLPIYDKVYPRAWAAHMELAMNMGRDFPRENLGIFYIHKMPQPHAENFLLNHIIGTKKWPQYVHEFGGLDGKVPDWVLWIEDDAVPPTNGYELLRSKADPVKRPVMHSISFDRARPFFPSIWRRVDGQLHPIHDWKNDTVYQIDHSGTCFCLIHASVFPKLKRPWFDMRTSEPGCDGILTCRHLAERMTEAGIPIMAYTGCVTNHMGEHVEIDANISRKAYFGL